MALVAAEQEKCVTNNRLQQLIDTRTVNSNKMLSSLVDKRFLEADCVGRGAKYQLSVMFDDENSSFIEDENEVADFEVKLDQDKNKILNYIISHGLIANSLCRTKLDLKKHKSVKLFNSLMKKKKSKK